MKELSEKQWEDFSGHNYGCLCSFCKQQRLDFSEPNYDNVAGIDVIVIAVTCLNCGHIELFNVAEAARIADDIDEKFRGRHLR